MSQGRIRWSRSKVRSLDSRRRRSGLSIQAFCLDEGIPRSSFDYWRRRLREDDAPSRERSSFVELELSGG